jgi:hypothetical protein
MKNMGLVGKYFVELGDENVVVGKVMDMPAPYIYLITYRYKDPDPPLYLKDIHEMAEGDFTFFESQEAALADFHNLSKDPDKVVKLVT